NLRARLDDVDLVRVPVDKRDGAAASLLNLDRITALVDGSLATHHAELNATGRNQRLSVSAKGGMVDGGRWHGVVEELSASHPLLKLPAPARTVTGGGGAGTKPAAADAGEP